MGPKGNNKSKVKQNSESAAPWSQIEQFMAFLY